MGIFYTFVSGLKSPRVSLWAWGNKRPKTAAQKGLLASDDGDDSLTRAIQNAGQDTAKHRTVPDRGMPKRQKRTCNKGAIHTGHSRRLLWCQKLTSASP